MRIAIVDDLAAERTLLKDRLEWQLQRRNVQADILEYDRPCAGGLSGTGAALSGQALYRSGHRRADGRAACPRSAAG